jgi:GT2 family glycosyltransferase
MSIKDHTMSWSVLDTAPKVSVIIPAYDASSYITEALESVFSQTYRDFEVIVINDGSPDTDEFEQKIQPYRKQLLYIKQENRGPGAARNCGIRVAKGEFVAFLDSDDTWKPEYLAEQMQFIAQAPLLDLVYCDGIHVDEGTLEGKKQMSLSPSTGPVTFRSLLVEECKVLTSLTVARKRAVINAGLFDERYFRCEDYDLWLRMAYQGCTMMYHTKVLGYHRNRAGSLASVETLMLATAVEVLLKLEQDLQLDVEMQRLLYRQRNIFKSQLDRAQGKKQLLAGDAEQARESLKRAYAVLPSAKLGLLLAGLCVAPHFTVIAARLWNGRMVRKASSKRNAVPKKLDST